MARPAAAWLRVMAGVMLTMLVGGCDPGLIEPGPAPADPAPADCGGPDCVVPYTTGTFAVRAYGPSAVRRADLRDRHSVSAIVSLDFYSK